MHSKILKLAPFFMFVIYWRMQINQTVARLIIANIMFHPQQQPPTHPTTMPPESTPSKNGGSMSLYANLLDPSAESTPGTISRAPVVFKQSSETDAQPDESAAKKQQLNAGTFEFL